MSVKARSVGMVVTDLFNQMAIARPMLGRLAAEPARCSPSPAWAPIRSARSETCSPGTGARAATRLG